MIDAVVQPTDVVANSQGLMETLVRLRVPVVAATFEDPVPDETRENYLRPEFTEALVRHMHKAKRLVIQDHQG